MSGSMHDRWSWRHLAAFFLLTVLAACGGGGGGSGGDTDDDITVSVTTAGGATTVAPGGTLAIRAEVLNSNNKDVTWSLQGSTCPAECGSITATGVDSAQYRAPANVPTAFAVTVRAASAQNPGRSGSVALSVSATASCPANSGLLHGSYAVALQGFDVAGGGATALVGSLSADGCGVITGGTVDLAPASAGSAVAVSGSYTIGTDGRGTVTMTLGSATKSFSLALGQISGGIVQRAAVADSGSGTGALAGQRFGSGTLWRQDPGAFAFGPLAGNYAYLLNGWTTGGGARKAIGGTVTLGAGGAFASGLQDENQFRGAVTTGRAWTGSAAAPAATSGRAVLSADTFGAGGGRAVMYIVDGARSLALVVDGAGTVLSGTLARQSGSFGPTSVQGGIVSWQTANYTNVGYEALTMSALSLFAADGAAPQGTLSSRALDLNSGGNLASYLNPGEIVYTYRVAANGQVTVYNAGVAGGKYYLTSANTGFLLGLDPGVSIGGVHPQVGLPLGTDKLSGSYFATVAPGGAPSSLVGSGIATSPGNAFVGTVMDVGAGGALTTRTDLVGGALVDTGNGRLTDARGNVIYMLMPDRFVVLSLNSSEFYPIVFAFER